jgi:hypothetical protein
VKRLVKGVVKAVKHVLRNPVVRTALAIAAAWYAGVYAGNLFYSSGIADALGTLSVSAYNAAYGAFVGAGAGFAGGFVGSGGDLSLSLKAAVAGGFTGGFMGYMGYGSNYPASRIAANGFSNGVSSKIQGGDFMDGLRLGLLTSIAGYGLNKATAFTDRLKRIACVRNGSNPCLQNQWGELLTDGARDAELHPFNPNETANWFTKTGMASEGSGQHLYNENSYLGRFINQVSKVHDFQNSWSYNMGTGWYVSRGVVFDTLFQAYSFAGMLPAAAFTSVGLIADKAYITDRIR